MIEKEFVAALVEAGFNTEQVHKALHCFDSVLINYTITQKEANIVKYDSNNANQQYVNLYTTCRKFEGCAECTVANMKLTLGRFLSSISCALGDVTPMQIRMFLASCQRPTNKGTTVSNSSIEKYKQCLNAFYKWLVKERIVTYNPVEAIPSIKTRTVYQGCLSVEELKRLKFACRNIREQILVEFLVSSGCRIQEFVNIKISDIDFSNRSVKVLGKGDKERIVFFSAEAKILLEKWLSQMKRKPLYIFSRSKVVKNNLTSTARARLEIIYKRVADRISLPKVTPHTLRRTFATLLLRKGTPLEQVSRLLGHANIQTTLRYVDITEDDLQKQHFKFVA